MKKCTWLVIINVFISKKKILSVICVIKSFTLGPMTIQQKNIFKWLLKVPPTIAPVNWNENCNEEFFHAQKIAGCCNLKFVHRKMPNIHIYILIYIWHRHTLIFIFFDSLYFVSFDFISFHIFYSRSWSCFIFHLLLKIFCIKHMFVISCY